MNMSHKIRIRMLFTFLLLGFVVQENVAAMNAGILAEQKSIDELLSIVEDVKYEQTPNANLDWRNPVEPEWLDLAWINHLSDDQKNELKKRYFLKHLCPIDNDAINGLTVTNLKSLAEAALIPAFDYVGDASLVLTDEIATVIAKSMIENMGAIGSFKLLVNSWDIGAKVAHVYPWFTSVPQVLQTQLKRHFHAIMCANGFNYKLVNSEAINIDGINFVHADPNLYKKNIKKVLWLEAGKPTDNREITGLTVADLKELAAKKLIPTFDFVGDDAQAITAETANAIAISMVYKMIPFVFIDCYKMISDSPVQHVGKLLPFITWTPCFGRKSYRIPIIGKQLRFGGWCFRVPYINKESFKELYLKRAFRPLIETWDNKKKIAKPYAWFSSLPAVLQEKLGLYFRIAMIKSATIMKTDWNFCLNRLMPLSDRSIINSVSIDALIKFGLVDMPCFYSDFECFCRLEEDAKAGYHADSCMAIVRDGTLLEKEQVEHMKKIIAYMPENFRKKVKDGFARSYAWNINKDNPSRVFDQAEQAVIKTVLPIRDR